MSVFTVVFLADKICALTMLFCSISKELLSGGTGRWDLTTGPYDAPTPKETCRQDCGENFWLNQDRGDGRC